MKTFDQFNSKNSQKLFGMKKDFELLKVFTKRQFPQSFNGIRQKRYWQIYSYKPFDVFIFDRQNYDEKNEFKINSLFHKSF